MQRGLRRSLAVLGAAALAVSGVVLTAGTSRATASFAFTRYAGADRYDTAAKAAVETFGTADSVIIASGLTYADALAGAYAAGQSGVPVLLTAANSLPAPTGDALTTLKTTKAIIVGGTASVGPGVESALRTKGITPSRIAGANRYATAYEIATDNGPAGVGKVGDDTKPTALLVSGENFPDALSAGPLSFAAHLPILLTTSATLSPDADKALQELAITRVIIVGGTASVSPAVEAAVAAKGIQTERLAGTNRVETAAKVADFAVAQLKWPATHVDLSRGDAFPDSLAGAAHAGKNQAAALLTESPTALGSATKSWLTARASTLTAGHINGGTGAVSAAVEAEATEAAKGTSGGSSTTTSLVPGSSTTSSTSSTSSTTTTTACPIPLPIC